MDLLSFPAWIKINRAVCDQLNIKIPWTKIKSVPIQMNLNEVTVEVEVCEEFRDVNVDESLANLISMQQPSKYGFVDRVIDGMTVTVNSVLITFKSKLMSATFNLSRVLLESRCPNWKPGELSLTKIKEVNRGQILLFRVIDWQTMRLEAKCLTNPDQAPLRLITNHAQCRVTIKKKLADCSVIAARIFVIFEDILWVLTFAQFISAASFVEYIFALIKRSPMSKKSGMFEDQNNSNEAPSVSVSNTSISQGSVSFAAQSAPLISPLGTPVHTNFRRSSGDQSGQMLTGNLSSASLNEQKFLCYDLIETSLHLFIDKVDAHLYDDIEVSPETRQSRDSGGALQTTLDQIQVDCYPYSRVMSDRKHWYRWFDPSPNSRKHWINNHFAEFDLCQLKRAKQAENAAKSVENLLIDTTRLSRHDTAQQRIPTAHNDQLLSLTVLVKIKDYCMNCVATLNSMRSAGLNKFIQTDKDYQMPSEMPSLYLELNYFYYFDSINRMMVYEDVPDPLAFIHLSPTKLLFDPPTLVFLNSFHINLSKALAHLNDIFPEEKTPPKIHCRIEILMPQISLPAKTSADQPLSVNTSTLLVKSGKITLSSSIHDKNLMSKLLTTIEKLKESPTQPINVSSDTNQPSPNRRDNSCTGDWTKVWNASLLERMTESDTPNFLWVIQFEPVWMDFLNYDVDEVAASQRLEPIVEPFNACAFVHLDLSSSFSSKQSHKKATGAINTRDIISILVSVIDGSIMANMDKIQFGFLQRLGAHVEKLIQRIKDDASSIIQLDTVVEDTLEINLTAYIKDIKARLILGKKIETSSGELNTSKSFNSGFPICGTTLARTDTPKSSGLNAQFLYPEDGYIAPTLVQSNATDQCSKSSDPVGVVYSTKEPLPIIAGIAGSNESLDECAEAADDASCLFLGESNPDLTKPIEINPIDAKTYSSNSTTNTSATTAAAHSLGSTSSLQASGTRRGKSPIEESLLINLDEMEQSSSLFAKVNLKSRQSSPQPAAQEDMSSKLPEESSPITVEKESSIADDRSTDAKGDEIARSPVAHQEIETESISYLELSMSQLMVRRITETKRRPKF